jgi:hypothetical protein
MTADLASALEACLEHLAAGETLEACLARYPQHARELRAYLGTAAQLEKASQLRPTPAFKARARTRLMAHMAAHPRLFKMRMPRRRPLFPRLALGMGLALIALAVSTTALAQSALPGGTLYPWKLSSEQAWHMVAPDPAGVDIIRADRRVDEALAVSGDEEARGIALDEYHKVVAALEQYKDPATQQRVELALKTEAGKLNNAGLSNAAPVVQVETPLTATPATANTPRTSSGAKNQEKNPTATPLVKFPDGFGH